MTTVPRLSKPVRHRSNGLTASSSTSGHRSQCKICGLGLFSHQDAVWSRQPMGLVHAECAREATE